MIKPLRRLNQIVKSYNQQAILVQEAHKTKVFLLLKNKKRTNTNKNSGKVTTGKQKSYIIKHYGEKMTKRVKRKSTNFANMLYKIKSMVYGLNNWLEMDQSQL